MKTAAKFLTFSDPVDGATMILRKNEIGLYIVEAQDESSPTLTERADSYASYLYAAYDLCEAARILERRIGAVIDPYAHDEVRV